MNDASGRRPSGLSVAVLSSVAMHALLVLSLWGLASAGSRSRDDGPLAEIPVVVGTADDFLVSPVANSLPADDDSSSESDAGPIQVAALPFNSPTSPDSEEEAPRVNAWPAGVSANGLAGRQNSESGQSGSTFFGAPVQARSAVFLIDRSISMGLNGGLDAAKQELRTCLEQLPATTRYQVLFYNRFVEAAPTAAPDRLLASSEETRLAVLRLADAIRPEGGTDHGAALRRALALRCDAILFVTDADDLKAEQVRAITELNGGRTAIHALEWSRAPEANDALQALARLNRGTHRKLAGDYHPVTE